MKYALLLLFTILVGAINNSLSSALTPVAMLFVIAALAAFYGVPKVSPAQVLLPILVIPAFPFIIVLLGSDRNLNEAIDDTIDEFSQRFSYETIERTVKYFNVFGIKRPLLDGRTNNIHTLVSGKPYFHVSNYMFRKQLSARMLRTHGTGNMNAHHVAYTYSDYGLLGAGVISFH